jgi:H+/gluconate symporter-like permease
MNLMENFARQFVWEFVRVIDLALQNWAITMILLIVFILGAGRQRKRKQRHLETVGSN